MDEKAESTTPTPLMNKLDEAKKLLDEINLKESFDEVLRPNDERAKSSSIVVPPSSGIAEKIVYYADNDKRHADVNATTPSTEASAKAAAVKTFIDVNNADAESDAGQIEYKPHNQGGYAVSRNTDKLQELVHDKKAIEAKSQKLVAQQFLLDQIKAGWPYDEKFYRSESKLKF